MYIDNALTIPYAPTIEVLIIASNYHLMNER